ncbi:MAG: hypothetical protein BWY74_03287 [Firmicutes bacterium ADurb.Bin419]|nr:MAG: hypothetical protein BWY74_03287 [Firmicutes bacterium ADurb.Bin419]
MKKLAIILLSFVMILIIFTGCSGNERNTSKKIPELTGEWKQSNSKSNDSFQSAKITTNTIEIYLVSDNGDTKSLY